LLPLWFEGRILGLVLRIGYIVGIVFVIFSATPLPIWFYCLWFASAGRPFNLQAVSAVRKLDDSQLTVIAGQRQPKFLQTVVSDFPKINRLNFASGNLRLLLRWGLVGLAVLSTLSAQFILYFLFSIALAMAIGLMFKRCYSLCFLAQFGPEYDVFPPAAPPMPAVPPVM
jgi:hypothetical protein